jgi:hypothetical protein
MRVTYYCLKPIQVGDEWRQPGDLIPEAAEWKMCRIMVQNADIAPVLVETLPKAEQTKLQRLEEAVLEQMIESEGVEVSG